MRLSSLIEAALRGDRKIDKCFRAIFVIRLLYYSRFSLLSLHPLHPLIAPKPRSREAAARKMISRDFFPSRARLSSREPGRDDDVFFLSLSSPPSLPLPAAVCFCNLFFLLTRRYSPLFHSVSAQRLFYTRRDVSLRVKALAREKCNKRLGVFLPLVNRHKKERERELFLFTPLTFVK